MPEPRDARITFNIEPTFRAMLDQIAATQGVPTSIFCRKLVVKELRERGLLTEEVLFRMATTDSIRDLERLTDAG